MSMGMRYAYYPGCSLHSTAKEFDQSTRKVCEALGIELAEIPDWSCCGATSGHATNKGLSIALPLRNLAKAEQMGLDVVAPCAACFNRLKSADHAIKEDPDLQKLMREKYGISYEGKIKVQSLLSVIAGISPDAITPHVKRRLEGLKVACYYGCLLLRPPDVACFDDPENPTSLEGIISALGAEPVEWAYRNECCGASLSICKPEIVVKLTRDILSSAKGGGANCVATACPLCQGNLDMRQPDIAAKYGVRFDMPIFYFTQLMGIAFGLSKDSLGIGKLLVNPEPALASIGR